MSNLDPVLRPKTLNDIIGLEDTRRRLHISITAAKARGTQLPHILLVGRPGTGKTALANAIANEMGTNFIVVNAATIKNAQDLFQTFKDIEYCDTIFVDEVHSLPKAVQEFLLTAMESYRLDIPFGRSRIISSMDIEPFTLIGATTHPGKLGDAFKARFRIKEQLAPYTLENIANIIGFYAEKLQLPIQHEAALYIASKSRTIPRLSVDYLLWIRDYAMFHNEKEVTVKVAKEAMREQGIDEYGFNIYDRRYLRVLYYTYSGGPCGIKALSNTLIIAEETLSNDVEPYLLECGLIIRGPNGRSLSSDGIKIAKKLTQQKHE